MKAAEKRELVKNLGSIAIVVLVGIGYSYGSDLLKPKIDPQVSAEATRRMKEQMDCSQKSSDEYIKTSSQLELSEMEMLKAGKNTVAVTIAEHRLKETECIQQATCEYIETNKQHDQMLFNAEFNSCLDDYREDAIDPPSPD